MSTLYLQLESALADARASVERAGETLHDASVAAAQRKSEYDMAAEQVRRLESALSALHGAPAPTPASGVRVDAPPAPRKPRPEPEGPECSGCGERGTLVKQGNITTCTACKAQFVA